MKAGYLSQFVSALLPRSVRLYENTAEEINNKSTTQPKIIITGIFELVSWLITRFRNRVPGCWNRVTQIRLYCIFFFLNSCLFMAALCNRAGHIYFHPVVSSFFPRLISAVRDWMSIIHTWCGLSVNLQCRSETCCARLAENTASKKSPSGHHPKTLSGYIFATKAWVCGLQIFKGHMITLKHKALSIEKSVKFVYGPNNC